MNSLSYACPELLEGEDGLSDAARAERQREWEEICEPIRQEQEQKHQSTNTNPSRSATTTPPPAYNSGTKEACTETPKPVDERCSTQPTVALKPKTDWTYIAYCYRVRGEGLFKFFQYPNVGFVDPKAVFFRWRCGSCRAILLYWHRLGPDWEDGYCGQCGTLNRKPPKEYQPMFRRPGESLQPLMVQPQDFDDEGKVLKTWLPLEESGRCLRA